MTERRLLFVLLGAGFAALAGWWLIATGLGVLRNLLGDWRQFAVALLAALIMGAVGVSLTMGRGRLAGAGQYEKIAVWAALLLSVVSAITTSTGLLGVLSANPGTGELLMVGMALLIGLGVQLSMLIYALRIGDGLLQLSRAPRPDPDFEEDDAPEDQPRRRILGALAVIAFCGLGAGMVMGHSGADMLGGLWTSLRDTAADAEARGPYLLGPVLLGLGVALGLWQGLFRQPAQLAGIGFSVAVYMLLLLVSSGFGYLSYFMAAQSEEVRAIDRDNHIQTQTAALTNRIREAALEDSREALTKARSGEAYKELSKRIGEMADLFVREEPRLQAEIEHAKADRARALQAANDAASRLERAQQTVDAADARIEAARRSVNAAKDERTRQLPTLEQIKQQGEANLAKALAGEDGTGVAACGSNCNAAKRQIADAQREIDKLTAAVATVENALRQETSKKTTAQRELEQLKAEDAPKTELPTVPLVLTDRSSFTKPMSEYDVDPSKEQLRVIWRTCTTARNMLIDISVPSRDIPLCGIADVEMWLTKYEERQAALGKMEIACARTEDEIALENEALVAQAPTNPSIIPAYLRGRLAWVDRCMMAANTGSENMTALAIEQNRLESEYTTAGYDVRRVLSALTSGNRYAKFALTMALIVDLAILLAGFSANAFRGRDLANDQRLVSPDQIDDRIAKVLDALSPGAPHLVALRFTLLCQPRPYHEVGDSPFTHRIRLDRGNPEMLARMRLVLDAAGPAFARFGERQDDDSWLLHGSLVALLIGRATTNPHPDGFPIEEARPEPGQAVTPLYRRPQGLASTHPASSRKIDPGIA